MKIINRIKCKLYGHIPRLFKHDDETQGTFPACERCGTLNVPVPYIWLEPLSFKDWCDIRGYEYQDQTKKLLCVECKDNEVYYHGNGEPSFFCNGCLFR